MNKKGQGSFEMILVTVFVIALAAVIMGYYISIQDSTVAMAILKSELLVQLSQKDKFYSITSITSNQTASPTCSFQETGDSVKFCVVTDPATLDASAFDLASIKAKIASKTKYRTVTISVNTS